MTSETPEQNDSTTPARRAPRRRATRAASAPQPAPAPIVVPTVAPPAPEAAEAPKPVQAAEPAAAPQETVADKPARRSRRATRSTAGETTRPGAAPDAPVESAPSAEAPVEEAPATPEPAAEPEVAAEPAVALDLPTAAAPATATGSTLSLDDIVLPSGPAAPTAEVGEPAAPTRRRRASRATGAAAKAEPAAPAADAPQASVPAVTEAGEDTAAAPAQKAPARSSRGRKSSTSEVAATEQAATEQAPAKGGRTKGGRAKGAGDSQGGEPQRGGRGAGQEPDATQQPVGTPRLATTALLFQAPDLSTARSRRRAQSKNAEVAAETAPSGAVETAPENAAEASPAPEQTKAPARRRRSKAAEPAAEAAQGSTDGSTDEVVEAATAAETTGEAAEKPAPTATEPLELTEADEAAVGEIEEIESELVAEGVELVELGPADLVEDGEDAEIRPRRRRRRGGRGRRGGRRPEGVDGDDVDLEDDAEDEGADDAHHATGEQGTGEDVEAEAAETDAEAGDEAADAASADDADVDGDEPSSSSRRRRRRRRGSRGTEREARTPRVDDEITALKGSTRLEAKRQRRREGRDHGRRRQIITEAEFLARREAVNRSMIVREQGGRTQIAVLEDGVLVEHYVSQQAQASMVGNVYLGRVQNVLPSMEAAFVDVGKGRNAVLYAGEVNWDAAGIEGQPRRIEDALKSGDSVLVQVTKDPIGHKGARLTSQITLAGRYLVFVPGGGMTGISRKLPDTERNRLKKILRDVVPEGAGVIVRTAAEGASEEELRADVERLQSQWQAISAKAEKSSTSAPALLQGEPDMAIRVVRDIFNDDFSSLVVQGDDAWSEISSYVTELAPDLRERVTRFVENGDVFARHRIDEQLAKGMDRKVWLPSGGSLVIDRTEAMTVVDVNTGKFTGSGGTLEETVTRNNLEAAEEIVRQLRLRDIGGIIVIDFVDMVLESNRDLVLRRLVECLGRDRTKHQVAEVTSLGLVQMTRKRVGQGLVEAFSSTCEHCKGRGFIVHDEPIERGGATQPAAEPEPAAKRSRRKRGGRDEAQPHADVPKLPEEESEARKAVKATLATIAAAAAHAHDHDHDHDDAERAARTVSPDLVIDLPEPSTDAPQRDADTGTEAGVAATAPATDAGTEASVEAPATEQVEAEQLESAQPAEATDDRAEGDAPEGDAPEAGAAKGAAAEGAAEPAEDAASALTPAP